MYLKDLWIFNSFYDLKDIVLIDNSSHSFAYQLENGYPILSYYNNPDDRELVLLTQYMKFLHDKPDVWPYIKWAFPIGEYINQWIWMEVEGVVEVCVEEVNDDDIDAELAKLMEDSESTDNVETPQQPDPTHVRQKSMAPPQMCADSIELMD